ncbi:MAG: Holliday junction resolvase RuvX [Erysipelotrichaceae bacterium]|nr:Holliday junction resolvase RuvX [Erysipelotrichaceae bacterium]
MRLLGLDLGSRTIGIALSDSAESMALMKETFRFAQDDYDAALDRVEEYVQEYGIKEVVLGFPKHMNGDIGEKAQLSIDFKDAMEKYLGVKVYLQDERLTTASSLKTISLELGGKSKMRKSLVDQMSAANILQDFLDRRKKEHVGE